nr:dolichol kinase sec59 [Quercus suber]
MLRARRPTHGGVRLRSRNTGCYSTFSAARDCEHCTENSGLQDIPCCSVAPRYHAVKFICLNHLIFANDTEYARLRPSMSSSLNLSETADKSKVDLPYSPDVLEDLRTFNRTPRPYFHEGVEVLQDAREETITHDGSNAPQVHLQAQALDNGQWHQTTRPTSAAGSESGTEADDERTGFVKALPPATMRLRKGLKTGERNKDTLLTPSELDEEGRKFQQDYFGGGQGQGLSSASRAEQEKFQRRRLAEFIRRSSEVALIGVMIICVLCGRGVAARAWEWKLELLCHVLTIAVLILAYPVKLSIVDTQTLHTKLWHRFRVPASFDPATVLYPPLLPVLVALSVCAAQPAVILPNIVLGLSSLPQRLFPRSSRLGGYNTVHWLVSIIPLIAPTMLMRGYASQISTKASLSSEMLVTLYPLHHALLQPLHYLTRTSLLMSELHLLSTALINLLLLVHSPQMVILKACLWIGGATLFVLAGPVLNWNVTLARVPKWKLRKPGHMGEERRSLADVAYELISLQRAASAFNSVEDIESDADEDEPLVSIKEKSNHPSEMIGPARASLQSETLAPTDLAPKMNSYERTSPGFPKQASPTWPHGRMVAGGKLNGDLQRRTSSRHSKKSSRLPWYLRLTPTQAERRKWIYAGYVYAMIVVVVGGPVRMYVSRKALNDQEPILWAFNYMLGQLPLVLHNRDYLGLQRWITPPPLGTWQNVRLVAPMDFDSIRMMIGSANARLLIIGYWVAVLLTGLLSVFSLTAFVEVDTRRKIFHGTMVAMLLPSIYFDPCSCALALGLGLTVFLLLEVIRAGQVPPLGNAIGRFVAPYVDGRDLRGPVVVSHLFLLIGCAVPLWLSLASIPRSGELPWAGWELSGNQREVAMLSGVICVGMGDAAASLIGRRYGRHKWIWVGGKSLEGSAAFAVAVTLGLLAGKGWQAFGGWADTVQSTTSQYMGSQGVARSLSAWLVTLVKSGLCACGASFMEAVLTGANDNVVVPVALWLLVKGLQV